MDINKKILVWAICATFIAVFGGAIAMLISIDAVEKRENSFRLLKKYDKKLKAKKKENKKFSAELDKLKEEAKFAYTGITLAILSKYRDVACGCMVYSQNGINTLKSFGEFMNKYFDHKKLLPKHVPTARKMLLDMTVCLRNSKKTHEDNMNRQYGFGDRIYH